VATGSPPPPTGPFQFQNIQVSNVNYFNVTTQLGPSALVDGDFSYGPWTTVGDCNASVGAADAGITSALLPRATPTGLPALRLTAGADLACEDQGVAWTGGAMLVHMLVRHVSGAPPSICLAQSGIGGCTTVPPLPVSNGWEVYQGYATPDAGTETVRLQLYSNGTGSGPTVNDYADVMLYNIPDLPHVFLVGTPVPRSPLSMVVQRDSYDGDWSGPPGSQHVVANGIENGWVGSGPPAAASISYKPTSYFRVANYTSLGGAGLLLLLVVLVSPAPRYIRIPAAAISRRLGIRRKAVRPEVSARGP
jgi:hypothetical protein